MRTLDQIIRKLRQLQNEYIDQGYGDIHDQIYYQIVGAYDEYEENENDESLLKELNELVDQLESHLNYIKNKPEFNWIFG